MRNTSQSRAVTHTLKFVVGIMALCGLVFTAHSTVLIDENFDAGYNRTANSIAGSNMAMYRSRTNGTATVSTGSLSFSDTSNHGADGYFSYFTDVGANIAGVGSASSVNNGHLLLGVGDQLTVSIQFNLQTMPADVSIAALRFGLFDNLSLRATNDLTGGNSNNAFTNNPGFATFVPLTAQTSLTDQISLRRRSVIATANIFSAQADYTQFDLAVGGAYSPLSSLTNYTFIMSVSRPDASTWTLSASIIDTLSSAVMTSGSSSTNDGVSSFSWFDWRFPSTVSGGNATTFTDLKVEVTAIPEPSTLVLAGAGLGMALVALRRRRR